MIPALPANSLISMLNPLFKFSKKFLDLEYGLRITLSAVLFYQIWRENEMEKTRFEAGMEKRKAQAIRIVPDLKIAIGIGLLKDMFHIIAVDLYGTTIYADTIPLPYSNIPSYYEQVAAAIKECIARNQYGEERILGISIATQGITSSDHTAVTYGTIMNNTGMTVEDFSQYLPYPCHLEHDSKSAACLELWNHPELDSAVIFLLNKNMGGAIITNHQIHQGSSMHSGTIEHMCVNPDGPLCYCGNRGCLETYCSADSLEYSAGLPVAEDIDYLLKRINSSSPFTLKKDHILVGVHGQYTPAIGAALFYVEQFLQSV